MHNIKNTINITVARHAKPYEQILTSFVFQSIIGAICLGALSMLVVDGIEKWDIDRATTRNTLIGGICTFVLTTFAMRKFIRYPGTFPVAYLLPTTAILHAFLILILLWFRIVYSIQILFTSFAFTILWGYGEYFLLHRYYTLRFALVPKGEALQFKAQQGAEFHLLQAPKLNQERFNGVIADLRTRSLTPEWETFLADCTLNRIPVYHTRQIQESLTGRVKIDHLSENEFGALLPSSVYEKVKRLIDVFSVFALLPLLILILAAMSIFIKLESKGPVFFLQQRLGFRGKPFTMIKFRSMYIDRKGGKFTSDAADPRITKTGRFMRRYRLDELPQVWNILLGQMSFIGPRPESMELSAWYQKEVPFFAYRHVVRPGISGWAQVNQGYAAEIDGMSEKLEYDFYYIKYFSFWLDTLVTFKTIKTILTGFGAR